MKVGRQSHLWLFDYFHNISVLLLVGHHFFRKILPNVMKLTLSTSGHFAVVDSVVGATMSSTGFITFKDLSTLACAVKTPLFHKPDVLVVKMAPEPRDIIWENAHVNLGWSKGREWTANVLLGIGAILWSIPVASIQALATADQIGKILPIVHCLIAS